MTSGGGDEKSDEGGSDSEPSEDNLEEWELEKITTIPLKEAPKKEEPKKAPAVVCVEKDKNGKAILDAKTNKPVVCPKKDEKKK